MRALASILEPVSALSVDGLVDSFRQYAEGLEQRLPNLLAAAVALALTVVLARVARRGVERALQRADAERHVRVVVATLAFYAVGAIGLVVALSLGGVNLGLLVGSLGLATVALGFALQDIVSNFSAGIVLLLEHPFTEGDHIAIAEAEGEVEEIRVRATRLRAPDGQLVIVPNKLLFTQVLTNSTATMRRRVEVPLELPYGQDGARELLLAAAAEVEGVSDDPAPRLLTQDLGQGARRLLLWFWVDARSDDPLRVRSEVLDAAERRLREAELLGEVGGEDSPPDGPGTASGEEVRS
ncbi:MAG TPA: mechanosensitive ion channel family protein [Actinomycetota bacterium]|jgi:small-conductance mechanosensitive channel|nr:mechanosensitive ion channel family protein [Actinomycetota bacterium]